MKIKDARGLFTDWGEELYRDFDAMIERNKKTDPENPLSNSNYCHALFFTDYMFRDTLQHIRMLSGGNADGFLSTLASSFENALKRITKNKGFVRVILITEKLPAALEAMAEKYPVLKLMPVTVMGNAKVSHRIICDDNKLRDEQCHNVLTDDSSVNEVVADVYFNSRIKAQLAAENFDKLWDSLNGG